jgi:hypothetical protein
MLAQPDPAEVPFYPDDLLPLLQHTLATLADVQIRYEIERDYLESRSGPRAVKDRLLAALEQRHRADRERLVVVLEELRLRSRRSEPATPHRTEH